MTFSAIQHGDHHYVIPRDAGDQAVRTPVAIAHKEELYTLTVNHIDRDGQPTTDYRPVVYGLDNDVFTIPSAPESTFSLQLPKGRYLVAAEIHTGEQTSQVVRPSVALTADTTIDLDARAAKPISITPPGGAQPAFADVGFTVKPPAQVMGLSFDMLGKNPGVMSTAQLGDPPLPSDHFTGTLSTQWTTNNGAEFYGLGWFQRNSMPTGFIRVVRQRDLATVHATFGPAPGLVGTRLVVPQPHGESIRVHSGEPEIQQPGRRTEYYNTDGVDWLSEIQQRPAGREELVTVEFSEPHTYRAGRTYHERFTNAVFGPAFPKTNGEQLAVRSGDEIRVFVPLHSDAAGNGGSRFTSSGSTALFLDGTEIGGSPIPGEGRFTVPAADGNYRLVTESTDEELFDLSTQVSAEWTFRSGHIDATTDLPLSAIRFTPKLDANNAAPAGKPYLIPVSLQRQNGDTARPRRLTVEVSYDEGATWQPAPVIMNLAAMVTHPATATSVSLRASASDRHGNTVRQTIIRAYRLSR